ncbi:hypothetical protein BaRGS_00009831 [Batillaria attramentaria]|uniref:Interferon-induced transmembrane protein n=1 Tax=Batillaria attramentaria TaxID=370345 RepID=A0ABD0LHK3_9CAEN
MFHHLITPLINTARQMHQKGGFSDAAATDYPQSYGGGQAPPPAYGADQYPSAPSYPGTQYSQPGGQGYSQPGGPGYGQGYPPQLDAQGYSKQDGQGYSQGYPQATAYPQPGAQQMPPGAYYAQPGQHQNVVVTAIPGTVMAQPYVRETTPPPETACGLVISILVLIFCAWPCGIGAIIYNRKAKTFVDMGQHTAARGALKTMYIFIAISILTGIITWVIIGLRIKATVDAINEINDNRYYG